jgi:hypothetical protein
LVDQKGTGSAEEIGKAVLEDREEQVGRGSYYKKNTREERDPPEETKLTLKYEKKSCRKKNETSRGTAVVHKRKPIVSLLIRNGIDPFMLLQDMTA